MNYLPTDMGAGKKPGMGVAKKSQNGYALLLVVFLLALLVVTLAAAAPSLITQDRREKEKEMIWRGDQYVRGINLYYRKTHRLPAQLEDLYTPKTGIRFMRGAYKDPLNASDGSWRLIYVAPDGRILGSLKKNINMYFAAPPSTVPPAGGVTQSLGSSSGSFSLDAPPSNSQNPLGNTNVQAPPPTQSGTNSQSPASQNSASQNPASPNTASAPSSTPSSDATQSDSSPLPSSNMIIGVGSKINKNSFLWLDGEKNYLQFEFIWNGRDSTPLSSQPIRPNVPAQPPSQ